MPKKRERGSSTKNLLKYVDKALIRNAQPLR